MIKKINAFLASTPATFAGGMFLILSFVLPREGIHLMVDPAWVTVIISGIPLLYLAIWRILYQPGISKISSALLICIAMFAAIAIGDLFAAGEVVFIMALGSILEDMTTARAKKGLKKLLHLAPTQGRKIVNGKESLILAEEIKPSDILRILPGEIIPVDGIILSGETSIEQSMITGESIPVDKSPGESVFCGTVNRFGSIDVQAAKVGEDTSLQKLIRMVQDAENYAAPMQRIADTFARWLVPIALIIAITTWMITKDIVRAVTVLVVFCPCALVLATPTAIMAAIGQATKHGVIIKSGEALEQMGRVDTIAFDKTGTLTWGTLAVSDIISLASDLTKHELLALTASAENKSEHPVGKAIVEYAKKKEISISESDDFKMISGKGIYAKVSGQKLHCGNERFFAESSIKIDDHIEATLERLRMEGKVSVLVAAGGKCVGIIALSDVLRPQAQKTVHEIHKLNLALVLLTGDNKKTADHFAAQVGIHNVHADLLPEQKVEKIHYLQKNGKKVCMIGDGVNDAPTLKIANVGVAMGHMGSDIAIEAADIVLMSDDIAKIPYLKKLSIATVNTIKLSIAISMLINFFSITFSVWGVLTPTTGALVHNAGSCFVVLIAALLYDRSFDG